MAKQNNLRRSSLFVIEFLIRFQLFYKVYLSKCDIYMEHTFSNLIRIFVTLVKTDHIYNNQR